VRVKYGMCFFIPLFVLVDIEPCSCILVLGGSDEDWWKWLSNRYSHLDVNISRFLECYHFCS
jgi:hypothetical protein